MQINVQMEYFVLNGVTVSIFLDVRRAKKNSQSYPVKIRVTYKGKRKYFRTGKDLKTIEWNFLSITNKKEIKDINISARRKAELNKIKGELRIGFRNITDTIEKLFEKNNVFSFEKLDSLLGKTELITLEDFFKKKIKNLRDMDRVGNAIVYECALNSLKRFDERKGILPKEINQNFLNRYQKWMRDNHKSFSTIGIYLRHLRAIINEAKYENVISDEEYPFGKGKFQIPTYKVEKRVLNKEQIKSILNYPMKEGSQQQMYRDLWIFSYLGNGMNINDLCRLEYKNIIDDEIQFIRKKTMFTVKQKKTIYVTLLPELNRIIEKWGQKNKTSYVFPFLNKRISAEEEKKIVRNLVRSINNTMDNISKKLGLGHINTYTARHSLATNLIQSNADVAFIRDLLGHTTIITTQGYLAQASKEMRKIQAQKLL